uniref:RNase H domain-containing protein n=1 Tax=Caenorhabditis tropicalis TaxID=1561998 RepID=A0A1I7T136_9PELO
MSVADNDEQISGNFVKVATTGYSFTDANGKRVAKYGIFWGKDDPRNGIRTLPDGSSKVAAMLTAILEAINVAREEDPPPSLMIYSDLDTSETLLHDLSIWAKRDFYTRNHDHKLKNAEILHDIFIAVQGLHLKIVHKPTVTDDKRNVVTTAIMKSINERLNKKEEEKQAEKETNEGKEIYCRTDNPVDSVAKIEVRVGTTLDKTGNVIDTETFKNENWPSVYVSAKCDNNNGFISAGYCTHWPDGHVGGGKSFRFAPFPVTLFRAELAAIEEALKQAVDAEFENVTVITSSAHFMLGWRSQWTRTFDEHKPFTSRAFYERIQDLCGKLKQAHFRYEENSSNSEIGKELEKKCSQGLSYVLIGKDTSEYELEVGDLVKEKEYRHEGVPIVRLFKTGTSMNAGFVWEDEKREGVSCCGTPSVLNRILEEAIERNESDIIIRADSEKLIKSFEAHLEVWRRNGWRNSQHKRIGKSAEWEKAWKLKQKVNVTWEIMDTIDEDDRLQNKRIPVYQKEQ